MNNVVFGKTMEKVRKHRHIKPVTSNARRNYLISGRNYRTTNFFFRKFISHRNENNMDTHE